MDDELRINCFKALACLYVAVEAPVADDINGKIKAYITAEEEKVAKLEAELIHNEGCYFDAVGEYRLEEHDLRKKVVKLKGWLRYLWDNWELPWQREGMPLNDTETEIESYIKVMDK